MIVGNQAQNQFAPGVVALRETTNSGNATNANQGGAAIGGPILKNKMFFFVNYETLRFVTSAPTQVIIPNAAYQSAVIANLNATGQAAQVPFYNQLFGLYNNAPGASRATPYNGTTYANAFEGNPKENLVEQLVTARLDDKLGPNDSFFAHFKWDYGVQPAFVDPINSAFDAAERSAHLRRAARRDASLFAQPGQRVQLLHHVVCNSLRQHRPQQRPRPSSHIRWIFWMAPSPLLEENSTPFPRAGTSPSTSSMTM